MEIIRAKFTDLDIFSKDELARGACCFYSEDKRIRYYFEIDGQRATLFANEGKFYDEAIEQFLFYSGFVCHIEDSKGKVLFSTAKKELRPIDILCIQPSQFYINEKKLTSCKRFIRSRNDIMIPIAEIDGRAVSLDGHTRMMAALELGYTQVLCYDDTYSEYINFFVEEAVRRGITNVSDMKIISDDEYIIKWHKFCDDYFKALEAPTQ